MSTQTIKFTKAAIDKIQAPEKGRDYYRDESNKHLGLTVTSNDTKSFAVFATVGGKSKRIAIPNGKYPAMAVSTARELMTRMLSEIQHGIDPTEQKRAEKQAQSDIAGAHKTKTEQDEKLSITLQDVIDLYCKHKGDSMKASTKLDYQQRLAFSFGDYLEKPLILITEEVVKQVNSERGKKAGAAMRVLRALFNFIRVEYKKDGLFLENPVNILTEQKIQQKYGRKKSHLPREVIGAWFDAVAKLPTIDREYYQFLLLTGVRAETEAASLTWDNVCFRTNTFTLPDTKNGESVTLPLPSYLTSSLSARAKKAGKVFPIAGDARPSRDQVIKETGYHFSRHDLRRTFLTMGESIDLSYLVLKRLSNHKSQEHDVTAGYIIVNLNRLRTASQRIQTAFMEAAGRTKAILKETK